MLFQPRTLFLRSLQQFLEVSTIFFLWDEFLSTTHCNIFLVTIYMPRATVPQPIKVTDYQGTTGSNVPSKLSSSKPQKKDASMDLEDLLSARKITDLPQTTAKPDRLRYVS
jgi:hypothetical protein